MDVLAPTLQTGSPVRICQVRVPSGSPVMRGDVIAMLECRKAEYPLQARATGTLRWEVSEGDVVSAGRKIAEIEESAEELA